MSMITSKKAGPIDKTVLLFSGGMDSVCIAHILKPDVLLIVPQVCGKYAEAETDCVFRLRRRGFFDGRDVQTAHDVLDLSPYERDDLIVPNRNAHLIL